MKKLLPYILGFGILHVFLFSPQESFKNQFEAYINNHPYSERQRFSPEEIKLWPKQDRPDLAWEQDFLSTLDPATGRPMPERLAAVHTMVDQLQQGMLSIPGSNSSPWVERGPNNVGGRTRALLWDPNDTTGKKVWAGGVTGGLWYNSDITSSSATWVPIGNFWDNIAITCIAYDPNNTNVFYVGTGEGWGSSSSRGGGIWKSADGGSTWTRLTSTTSFYYVNDIVVRNESGSSVVYAAVDGNYYNGVWHGSAAAGLQRSVNGGTSWSQVLPNIPGSSVNYVPSDLEIGSNNILWVGTRKSPYTITDRGGGRILNSTNGTTWTTKYTASGITNGYGRVELAVAPSNANYVYAIVENVNEVYEMVRTINGGSTWTYLNEPIDDDLGILSTDFSRGQAWYDLILAVDPNNVNKVIAGAVNSHVTSNGGTSWSQISKWSNNPNMGSQSYSYIHADHHNILFKPGSSTEVIFGTDGGVFWTNNLNNAAFSAVVQPRNNGYNVTQFYAGAIHPTSGSNEMLAGAQDNGTQRFTSAGLGSTSRATGGDGGFCFIDQSNPSYQITSYVYNSYYLSTNGGTSFQSTPMQSDKTTGRFINPTDYDDNLNVLYSARTTNTINRIKDVETNPVIDFISISGMNSMASHLRVSPYTTTSTTLFVGTESGNVFKVTNANTASPSTTNIGALLPAGHISCIEIGANESQLIVTFKNYGVTSVWYTSNSGITWVNKEGNLPDMPVRWALFNPNNFSEVLLATEVGVWSATNFQSSSPTWNPSNSGLSHVRVDMLQIRASDKRVMAITHGRGVFTSDGFNVPGIPLANFGESTTYPCTGETVVFTDSSSGAPTAFSWSFLPSTVSFVNGTSASSQNPEVQFNSAGAYSVTLIVSNGQGSDTLTRAQYIKAGGHSLPFVEDFESGGEDWTIVNPDNATTWALYTIGGTSPGNQAAGINNFNYSSVNQRDGLVSPALNFSSYSSVSMTFKYAYRRYSSLYQDSLAVFISTNCGNTWTRIVSLKEDGTGNFVTGSDLTSAFTPSSISDWCGSSPQCPTINLNTYAGLTNIKIKIENINGWGNNLYVDNVNITGQAGAAPIANFSANITNPCVNQSVSFSDLSTNNPVSWSWSFTPATVTFVNGTSANSQNPQVTFQQAGSYQVTLTSSNSVGSDQEIKSNYILVPNSLVPSISMVSSSGSAVCSGALVTFTASPTNGGSSPVYQWKINGNNVGTNSTTYSSSTLSNNDVVTVEMTSSASCASPTTVVSNSVTMTVNTLPIVTMTTSVNGVLCNQDTVQLSGNPVGGAFSGTSGVVGDKFIPSLAGSGMHWIYYTYANLSGCSAKDSIQVQVESLPVPTISVSSNVLTCNQIGYLYQWYNQNGPISGETGTSYTALQNGVYRVEISTVNCTMISDPVNIVNISLEELASVSIVDVYPNPAENIASLHVKALMNENVELSLYNAIGQLIWVNNWEILIGNNQFTIDCTALKSGVYQIRLNSESGFVTRRFEVK